ncbi:interleukin 12 receptor, beta 2a, like isoform 1-T2 [Synchiropus picturatus]
MALLPIWWQLYIFFVTANNRVVVANFLLSKPRCYIPCGQICQAAIHCYWDAWPDHSVSTNYTLHWEPPRHNKDHVNTGNPSGIILRENYASHRELSVWVQAVHQNGSAKSLRSVFDTGKIQKPPAPNITSSHRDPMEIHWDLTCEKLHLGMGSCDVRHRAETEKDWLKTDVGSHTSYEHRQPVQPGFIYEFQVRCACSTGLMSDWSGTTKILSQEMTPVGELDVWRDCKVSQQKLSCVLLWKKLPRSQARGEILGYTVLNSGIWYNISTARPSDQLVCDKTKCYHNVSLMSSAKIWAYNSVGASAPAYLHFPQPDIENNKEIFSFQMNPEKLDVQWDPPAHLSARDTGDDYVVQYKQVGQPLGQGFDWLRVNQSGTSITFQDQFRKHTPYQVSLYSVSHDGTSRQHSSVIAYSGQTIPPQVPSFKVIKINAYSVALFWEPIPLSMQNGVVLYYQIGGATPNDVHNVSAVPHNENRTFELKGLSPGRNYEVWIKAVTVAGPGANVTAKFKTKSEEQTVHFILAVLGSAALITIVCACILVRAYRGDTLSSPLCFDKNVPDPHNSLILKQMKNQINDHSIRLLSPLCEPHPEISILEVVENKPATFFSGCLKTFNLDQQMEDSSSSGESDRMDQRSKKEDYSQMLDSDGEQGGQQLLDHEEHWNSSQEDFSSGYEKHFMPTPQELLGC